MTQKEKIDFILSVYGNTAVSGTIKGTEHILWFKQGSTFDLDNIENIQVSIQYSNGEVYVPIEEFDLSWSARFKRMMQIIGKNYQEFSEMTGYAKNSIAQYASMNDAKFPQSIKSALIVFEWCYRRCTM